MVIRRYKPTTNLEKNDGRNEKIENEVKKKQKTSDPTFCRWFSKLGIASKSCIVIFD